MGDDAAYKMGTTGEMQQMAVVVLSTSTAHRPYALFAVDGGCSSRTDTHSSTDATEAVWENEIVHQRQCTTATRTKVRLASVATERERERFTAFQSNDSMTVEAAAAAETDSSR